MLKRGKLDRGIVEMVDMKSLAPAQHLLRKIDAAVDFERVYDRVESLYCEDNGRPRIDPVVLAKLKFAAMNLKKLANWKWDTSAHLLFSFFSCPLLQKNPAAS